MAATRELQLLLSLKDEASKELQKTGSNFDKVFKVSAAAALAAGSAIAGAFIKAAVDIDKANANIIKGTGASGAMLDSLVASARQVNRFVPQSLDEVSRAIADVNTRFGVTDDVLGQITGNFLDFSRVLGIDTETAIGNVSRAMGDWGIPTNQAVTLLDKLTAISQATGASIDTLTTDIVTYGVQLRTLGFSQDEAIAMLGKFEKEGVATSKVFSGLSIAMAQLSEQGVSDIPAAFQEAITAIKEAGTDAESVGIAMELFGRRAGPDLAIAVREGRFELSEYMKVLDESEGILDKSAIASLTLSEKIKMLSTNLIDIFTPTKNATGAFDGLLNSTLAWSQATSQSVENAGGLYTMLVDKGRMLTGWLEEKTGIITVLKSAWDNIVLMWEERAMPVIERLLEVLRPLEPFLLMFAKIMGVILYGAIVAFVKLLEVSLIVGIELLSKGVEQAIKWIDKFKSAWDFVTDVLAKVIGLIDRAISAIKKLTDLSGAAGFISSALGFGGARAGGGPVSSGTSYLVGERGPELFTPSQSGNIIPNHSLSGGGGGITVIVNGDVSGQELIQKVSDGIMNRMRLNQRLPI